MNSAKKIIGPTALSILFFFSVSFVTVLFQINPLRYYKGEESYNLEVGFPFAYYYQFWLRGNEFPNSGWDIENLFYNCFLTWLITTGIFFYFCSPNTKSAANRDRVFR